MTDAELDAIDAEAERIYYLLAVDYEIMTAEEARAAMAKRDLGRS